MYCSKCGTRNGDDARFCASCGQALAAPVPGGSVPVQVRVSGLAITAFVLGILSLFTLGLTILPALVFGIIAIVVINKSGGRLTGLAFAIIGIVLPICLLPLLMGILMPALARTRQLAFRMTCGTNLSGMGRAMLIYASDYEDRLPRAGSPSSTWGPVANWTASNRQAAFGMTGDGHGGKATISSCFYLLVRYAEVTPRSFLCKGDMGTTEFRLSDVAERIPPDFELIDAWDFGPSGESYKHCSYSYHLPFGTDDLTVSREPGFAVAADRSPWFPSPAAAPATWTYFRPDLPGQGGTTSTARNGNALAHQLEGQNVLFLDTHVEFTRRAYCSLDGDNIYTASGHAGGGAPLGEQPTLSSLPLNPRDSFLVHDPDTFRPAIR